MPVNIKQLAQEFDKKEIGITQGHRLCPGCGAPITVKFVMMIARHLGYEPVVGLATGCLEVSTTIYPYTAWSVPYIHNAFENVAATMSGVETAYRALKNKGKIPEDKKYAFIAFGGDGGTYDIGLQSLSGMLERGHKVLYVLYDNEGYMNTGNQRSGSTPPGSDTTTAPVGKKLPGKVQLKKNIVEIVAAHENVYAATAALSEPMDFFAKVEKALNFDGPSFLAVLSPCVRFWRVNDDKTVEISKLAVETKYWPLYEVERGVYRVTRKPRQFKPVEEFLRAQGRFRKLLSRPDAKEIIDELQEYVDRRWERLLALEEATKDKPIR
ncbi:thiamine pyrophosphate-dependent enzyme [Thermotoga neapolitana]|uniref:Pyruvate synthase subunit porB n=1 Tax=Thermotoga neapolitana (strain ATCC 49049 / DSM 4359 / NBRC 107923 / NS-E) TaxID=309803 RepID=B9K7C3_THENN|nr:thiamine pyrophosphate-dependent enzyme [Thermotoga neapolitana]MDK2786442.1 pyruvate ferredoxin oxidoreductase beta subunit [Thermotoga sp.]ACM22856.1 Pyruvate synthase subunit porB [Thermotoga neapolitana DSM 4359]KFZ22040.1 Pyruvate synthase subunit porB [Thermotoga neapolitana LA10]MDK2949761.1 pyruvate ferredoxin oxidoreductase beta subunit [Thermotoga sp.]HBF11476.1 pyruvate ferredoxin oxidoreductase [Thermotoga neapolitana]